MPLCNVCVEMGFHFDEIFEEQLRYKLKTSDSHHSLAQQPRVNNVDDASETDETTWARGYKHHSGYNALIRSAALGCELCRTFAYGAAHYSDGESVAAPAQLILKDILKAESESGVDPTEMQIYVVGRKVGSYSPPWFQGVAGVEVYFGKRKVFNGARVFCDSGDALASKGVVVKRPPFIRHLRDAVSILGRHWLRKCLSSHKECTRQHDAVLPSRVIDVGPPNGAFEPFIFTPPNGTRGSWLALSHCWGGKIPQMTTTHNISEREQCLTIASLPATFIDAIFITRDLGFRYLWIDSLCIIQDSISDWDHEASRMQDIYKYATLTIAATMSSNSNVGIASCCRIPKSFFPIPIVYQSTMLGIGGTLYFRAFRRPRGSNTTHFPRGPLTQRAWTVQEKVLCARTIHFGEEELVWDCNTCIETSEDSYPDFWSFTLMEMSLQERTFRATRFPETPPESTYWKEDLLRRWYHIICEYGLRQLTFEKDKLPAISGIAREIAYRGGGKYCAGMWTDDLHRGLLWSFDGEDLPTEHYIAPSWSWASVTPPSLIPTGRKVDFYHREHRGADVIDLQLRQPYHYPANRNFLYEKINDHDVRIITCEVELRGSDRYGQILSGYLVLEGRCIPAVECGEVLEPDAVVPTITYKRACVDEAFSSSNYKHIYCVVDNFNHNHHEFGGQRGTSDEGKDLEIVPIPWASDSESGSEGYDSDDSRHPAHNCFGAAGQPHKENRFRAGTMFIQISMWSGRVEPEIVASDDSPILFALLIEPTDNEGEYRRRGVATVPHKNGIAIGEWQKRTVRII